MLRYVPQVLRRARGLDPSDPLVELLANVLRHWPLSGVLSDVRRGPAGPPATSAGTRGSCSCMPSVWSATTGHAGGRAARAELGLL